MTSIFYNFFYHASRSKLLKPLKFDNTSSNGRGLRKGVVAKDIKWKDISIFLGYSISWQLSLETNATGISF